MVRYEILAKAHRVRFCSDDRADEFPFWSFTQHLEFDPQRLALSLAEWLHVPTEEATAAVAVAHDELLDLGLIAE